MTTFTPELKALSANPDVQQIIVLNTYLSALDAVENEIELTPELENARNQLQENIALLAKKIIT